MYTEVHSLLPFTPPSLQLKHSSCILTIVSQLVDILMLVANYFSDNTCSGSSRKGDIHSNKGTEIWIALLNSTDKNHFHFDVSPSDIIHPHNNALQANVQHLTHKLHDKKCQLIPQIFPSLRGQTRCMLRLTVYTGEILH